jgi:hypothetical protein
MRVSIRIEAARVEAAPATSDVQHASASAANLKYRAIG